MIWDKGKSKEIVTLDILVSKLKLKTVRYIRACPGLDWTGQHEWLH